jgi:hypothetical protein
MFSRVPTTGDWIALTKRVPTAFADSLTGGGLPRGTRGVVIDRIGMRLRIKFDSGFGIMQATVHSRDTRVVRRHGGADAFARRTRVTTALRAGVLFAMAAPFLYFIVQYLWTYRTTHGLLPALATGLVVGTVDTLAATLEHPVQGIVYLLLTTALTRWVWRR